VVRLLIMERTDILDLLLVVARTLDKLKIPYLITGGMAVFVWGRPRFTADIDIVIELKKRNTAALLKALRELSQAVYIDEESLNKAAMMGGEFNFIDGTTGVKIDFWVPPADDFSESQFQRRVLRTFRGGKIYFISPEDLILRKAIWYKESESSKQLEDIRSIFERSGDNLDKNYLRIWAKRLGIDDVLNKFL